jgi:predicted membrane channel-forming protein YqfA (hemolysin III family)
MGEAMAVRQSRFWGWFFAAAATYNLIIGGAGLLANGATMDSRVTSLLVACFGILYAIVASDPARFRPVIWSGIVGKLGILILLVPPMIKDGAMTPSAFILAGDALFTVGFMLFVLRR